MTPKQRLSYALKLLLAQALYWTGGLALWQRLTLRGKAVVLMYHRVLTDEESRTTASHPALVVGRDSFARQMALLKRRFVVLSADEFAAHLRDKRPFPSSSCLVTFDDGWRDNYTNALPVLAEHGLPALVFLPINYIGGRRLFWQEALTHLLLRAVLDARRNADTRARVQALLQPEGLAGVLDAADAEPRQAISEAIAGQKQAPRADTERLIQALASLLHVDVASYAALDGFIDWQQVHEMGAQRIAFGAHGMDHLLLTHVSDEEADGEIRGSRAAISSLFPTTTPTFSYPNGYLTPALAARVEAAGYRVAFITRRGPVSCQDDPLTIKRINIHEGATASMPMFLGRLVGLW